MTCSIGLRRSVLALAVSLISAGAFAQTPKSDGVYRIPYEDGTKVRVTNDAKDHSPVGRIDMGGREGSTYRIVAAADGVIRFIEDGFSAQQDSDTAPQCNNNYVWIEHPNGEWTKYSHMRKDSTTVKANLKVGDTVKAGTYLGDEGTVGCSSGSHLHFEVGVPRDADPITTVGGFLQDNSGSKRNRDPRICNIPGGIFKSGETYIAEKTPGNIRSGLAEVARHGMPISDYQCFFDQMMVADYEPVWLDMFDIGGKIYVNVVARKRSGQGSGFHGLTGAQYQAKFEQLTQAGYRPAVIESYGQGGGVRYAGWFKKASGPQYAAYHGLDAGQHQARFDQLTGQGYRPVSVSVVSSGGRRYTALYEKKDIGSWALRSQIPLSDYQSVFNENAQAGRRVVYLDGYRHEGASYLSAIFSSAAPAGGKARHGLSGGQYQNEYESARQAGMLTDVVTGYDSGGGARYAAVWRAAAPAAVRATIQEAPAQAPARVRRQD